jgi:hypothetical protein
MDLDSFISANPNYAQMVADFRSAGMDDAQIVGMMQNSGLDVTVGGQGDPAQNVRTADFQDANADGIDDRDQTQAGTDVAGGGATTTAGGGTTTTTTGGGTTTAGSSEVPFVDSVTRQDRRLDPITQQLLFGLDGVGGFIPGAFQAAERTFFDAQGRPIVIPQEVAGLTPDQIRAAQIARGAVGVQQPFIERAALEARQGIGALESGQTDQAIAQARALQEIQSGARFGLDQRDLALMDALTGIQRGQARAIGAEERLRGDLADLAGFQTGAVGRFAQQLGQQEQVGRRAADQFGMDLARARQQGRRVYDEFGRDVTDAVGIGAIGAEELSQGLRESERLLRGTTGDLDIGTATSKYFDPYEEQVVQQTLDDALKGLAQSDMAQRARDIQTGGESAFGSRARLTADERAEALGRGLAKEIGGLRSAGFQRAQQTAISEDERARQAARSAASGLASLGGQRYGARTGLSSQLSQAAQQKLGAGTGFGNLIQQTAQQQLASQQQLAGQMGQTAQAGLGAQQQLASQLGQQAQQRFAAGTGLGQQLGAFGQQAAGARGTAGQQGMNIAGQLAGQYGQIGQQRAAAGQAMQQARQGYGGFLTGLGQQAQQAAAADVASLGGIGAQQQQQRQRELDAQRAGLLQAQQAPLAQYQALMPFVQMAPAGFSTTQTSFTPSPSALQAGLGTGLSTLGALGNFYGQPQGTYYGQTAGAG